MVKERYMPVIVTDEQKDTLLKNIDKFNIIFNKSMDEIIYSEVLGGMANEDRNKIFDIIDQAAGLNYIIRNNVSFDYYKPYNKSTLDPLVITDLNINISVNDPRKIVIDKNSRKNLLVDLLKDVFELGEISSQRLDAGNKYEIIVIPDHLRQLLMKYSNYKPHTISTMYNEIFTRIILRNNRRKHVNDFKLNVLEDNIIVNKIAKLLSKIEEMVKDSNNPGTINI